MVSDSASPGRGTQGRIARFGIFDLDLGARELLRQGKRIKLQDQPFRILEHLVQHAGTLVTRDDLQTRLWSDGTFVDFDHSLNTAIKKLRQALDDDAENPRFVETVPRRGYRFIAPVQWVGIPNAEVEGSASPPRAVRPPRLSPRSLAIATVLCVLSLGALAFLARFLWRSAPSHAARERVPNYSVLPLTSYPGTEDFGALSPDGKEVAFSWDQGQESDNLVCPQLMHIFVKQIGSEQPLQLTSGDACELAPTWSPDGRYIAFVRTTARATDENPAADVVIISALGGSERKVATAHWQGRFGFVASPVMSWSPDGKTLALVDRTPDGNHVAIWLLSLETLQKRQLTFPTLGGDMNPAFSPDGTTVAFIRSVGEISTDLFTVPVSGGTPTRITNEKLFKCLALAWTADGQSLVYSGSGIRIVSAKGGASRPLLPTSVSDSLSIVGNRLVYGEYSQTDSIYSAALNGLKVAGGWRKVFASTHREEGARFSPDGKRVAFQSTRSGDIEIWVGAADGSNLIQLTHYGGPLTGSPRWSPDGQTIVYDSRPNGNSDIFAVRPSGGEPRQLTDNSSDEIMPSYSHDGRWIYFASNRGGGWNVWKIPAAGGLAIQLTHGGGFTALESPDGKYVYYARGPTQAGLFRVPAAGGAEEEVLPDLQPTLYGYWAVTPGGIYYAEQHAKRPRENSARLASEVADDADSSRTVIVAALRFYSFATRKRVKITDLPYQLATWSPGLEISPDGRRIMLALLRSQGADLRLVENFQSLANK